jgi:hypothetical protein
MKTDDEIKAFWGNELLTIPQSIVVNYPIPLESKSFLANVGVPTREGLLFPFFKRPGEFRMWADKDGEDYLVLAQERGQNLGLSAKSGNISVIDSRDELPMRFVNSDLASLVGFLQLLAETQKRLRGATEDEGRALIEQLRKEFMSNDAKALAGDENWWSVVLEQMEQGLL